MNINIKHIYQKNGHSCATTAIRMVMSGLGLTVPTDEELYKIFEPDPIYGTKYEDLITIGEHYNLKVYSDQEGTIELLDSLIEDGYMIIVGYHYYVPHAAVYLGSDDKNIYLHDPDRGPNFKIDKEEFVKDWEVNPDRFWEYLSEHSIDWPEDQISKQWYITFKSK